MTTDGPTLGWTVWEATPDDAVHDPRGGVVWMTGADDDGAVTVHVVRSWRGGVHFAVLAADGLSPATDPPAEPRLWQLARMVAKELAAGLKRRSQYPVARDGALVGVLVRLVRLAEALRWPETPQDQPPFDPNLEPALVSDPAVLH
ncbi:MAG: hypothetical protein LC792_15050 [Actinobacteria bacterium]|nr:hypothetical protein [Actinomycetota bacterium]